MTSEILAKIEKENTNLAATIRNQMFTFEDFLEIPETGLRELLAQSDKKLLATALERYGRLDILVNNAGVLRDRMVFTMSPDEWDLVIRVHLRGHFNVVRATISHFRSQQEGNYVMWSSTSGLIGNVGQSNYGAAKMGIVGLTRVLALV